MAKEREHVFEKSDEFDDDPEELLEPEEDNAPLVKREIDVDTGEHEADVYNETDREVLTESDEMEPWEEGFSEGASDRGHLAECAHCGKILSDDEDKVVERKFNGNLYRFCCEAHAEAGPKI